MALLKKTNLFIRGICQKEPKRAQKYCAAKRLLPKESCGKNYGRIVWESIFTPLSFGLLHDPPNTTMESWDENWAIESSDLSAGWYAWGNPEMGIFLQPRHYSSFIIHPCSSGMTRSWGVCPRWWGRSSCCFWSTLWHKVIHEKKYSNTLCPSTRLSQNEILSGVWQNAIPALGQTISWL